MAFCTKVGWFFCTMRTLISVVSCLQIVAGIYFSLIYTDDYKFLVPYRIKVDRFSSFLRCLLLVLIGLALVSFLLAFLSFCNTVRRYKSLSLFVTTLWIFIAALNMVLLIISLLHYLSIVPRLDEMAKRSLPEVMESKPNLIDTIQSKYKCCGITDYSDYNDTLFESLPASCCLKLNCSTSRDLFSPKDLNSSLPVHPTGCLSRIREYVETSLIVLIGTSGFCALLHIIIVSFMCTLHQRHKEFDDDDPKFVINHMTNGKSLSDSQENIQGSSKTIEEVVEITQI